MKKIVLGVIAISILHSILFFAQDLGISVVLFTVAMMGLIIYSLIVKNKVKNSKAFLLSIPIDVILALAPTGVKLPPRVAPIIKP